MEAELVDVEAQAAVLVANVDIDGVDAEVGRGLRGCCGGRHGEIIRRGDGTKKFSFWFHVRAGVPYTAS